MSMSFTKLFSSITESTVWLESSPVRICWITMLAMADRRGRVWASVPGLAHRARIDESDCRRALALFLAPDPESRTRDHEGRRAVEIDGGWQLLNYEKYRAIKDIESVRESKRRYIARKRAESRSESNGSSTVELSRIQSRQAEAEAEAEAEAVHTAKNAVCSTRAQGRGTAPIGARSHHRSHAFCGRVCVPAFLHDEFRRLIGGDEAEADTALRDWELATDKACIAEPIAVDPLVWWREKFRAWREPLAVKAAEAASEARFIATIQQRDAERAQKQAAVDARLKQALARKAMP